MASGSGSDVYHSVDEMSGSSSSSSSSTGSVSVRESSALNSKEDVCDAECETAPEKPRPPVAPRGEVILLVGPEEHEVRVHALILANASPVFASMLQAEQQQRVAGNMTPAAAAAFGECAAVRAATAASPARIPLPEDDPDALETICRVLHGRVLDGSDGRPGIIGLAPEEVLAVAIAADKYDCAAALALAVEHWLAPARLEGLAAAARDDCVGFRRCDLLLASYWFKHERTFAEMTEMLALNVAGSYEVLVDGRDWVDEQLAWKLALALERKRNTLRLTLYQVIMEHIHLPFFLVTPPRRRWWKPLARAETEDSVLRAIDREVFSTGMSFMSVGEAMRQAVEVPAVAYNRVSSLRRKYGPEAMARPPKKTFPGWKEQRRKPFHKRAMERGVEEWKRRRVLGLCLACMHPQMRCEKEGHGVEEGRAEWEREQWK